jgi:hypothetical protein
VLKIISFPAISLIAAAILTAQPASAEFPDCDDGVQATASGAITKIVPPKQSKWWWTYIEQLGGTCAVEVIETDAEPPATCQVGAKISASGSIAQSETADMVLGSVKDITCQ